MEANQFLLYGANGYTGRLIAGLASSYDLQPILAGRSETAIQQMGNELQLPYRVLDLTDRDKLQQALGEFRLVLHAAGPFQQTAKQMLDACIATKTHYIDITGEIPVFELARTFDQQAMQAGIMIMPGVGFDVVPTDCMALYLKKRMPNASHLQLAFASVGGGISHGTAATMIMGLGEGGAVRENGVIRKKPLGHMGMWVNFGQKRLFVMSIPWGDISTAYHTTGIPTIETYTGIAPKWYKILKFQWAFNWLLKSRVVKKAARRKLKQLPAGPTAEMRAGSKSLIWGKVQNSAGEKTESSFTVPDGYTLTAHSSLIITKKILAGNLKPGYQTPASVYGEDLVFEVPGSYRNPAT